MHTTCEHGRAVCSCIHAGPRSNYLRAVVTDCRCQRQSAARDPDVVATSPHAGHRSHHLRARTLCPSSDNDRLCPPERPEARGPAPRQPGMCTPSPCLPLPALRKHTRSFPDLHPPERKRRGRMRSQPSEHPTPACPARTHRGVKACEQRGQVLQRCSGAHATRQHSRRRPWAGPGTSAIPRRSRRLPRRARACSCSAARIRASRRRSGERRVR